MNSATAPLKVQLSFCYDLLTGASSSTDSASTTTAIADATTLPANSPGSQNNVPASSGQPIQENKGTSASPGSTIRPDNQSTDGSTASATTTETGRLGVTASSGGPAAQTGILTA